MTGVKESRAASTPLSPARTWTTFLPAIDREVDEESPGMIRVEILSSHLQDQRLDERAWPTTGGDAVCRRPLRHCLPDLGNLGRGQSAWASDSTQLGDV